MNSDHSQTSKMERLVEIANNFKPLIIFCQKFSFKNWGASAVRSYQKI